jgi:hypothetical protein
LLSAASQPGVEEESVAGEDLAVEFEKETAAEKKILAKQKQRATLAAWSVIQTRLGVRHLRTLINEIPPHVAVAERTTQQWWRDGHMLQDEVRWRIDDWTEPPENDHRTLRWVQTAPQSSRF